MYVLTSPSINILDTFPYVIIEFSLESKHINDYMLITGINIFHIYFFTVRFDFLKLGTQSRATQLCTEAFTKMLMAWFVSKDF